MDPRMAGLPPAVVALVHAGARALRDGQPRQAEPLLLQACAQAPAHPEPLRYLAILQLHTRRAPLAMQTLQRALAIAPDTLRGHLKRIYRKLGVHSRVRAVAEARRRHLIP